MRNSELFPCRAQGGGLAVMGLWLFLAGGLAAGFLLPFWGWAVFLGVWALAVAALLWLGFGRLTVSLEGERLTVTRGTLFPVEHTLPTRGLMLVSRVSTPLLRRSGCCVLLLRVPGQWLVLPALPTACGEALARMTGR